MSTKVINLGKVKGRTLDLKVEDNIIKKKYDDEAEWQELVEVPTKTSQLENDSGFVTAEYVIAAINGTLDEIEAMIDESGVLTE